MDSFLQTRLEKLNLKRKMLVLYLGCVLMPLVITDTFVFGIVIRSEQGNERHKMQNVVSAVKYSLKTETERAAALAKSI